MLWNGSLMAWMQVLQDTPPTPVATAQAVQPIDQPVPVEIVTARAVGVGNLRCTFYELWQQPVWALLPGLQGTYNLLTVLQAQINLGTVTMQKVIKSPDGIMRSLVYHNVVITDVDAGENISIGSMTIPKTMTFQYCYTTPV
jgi:hypothetical protein